MTGPSRRSTTLLSLALSLGAIVAVDVLYVVPNLQRLRAAIDNDRASKIVIVQQQSNLEQLTRDIESIQAKQAELDKSVWTFLTEDSFFTAIEVIAKAQGVTIDAPSIADATPTGTILPRAVTIGIHGSLARALGAVNAIQGLSPMVAIQQLTITDNEEVGDVLVTLEATTLWK